MTTRDFKAESVKSLKLQRAARLRAGMTVADIDARLEVLLGRAPRPAGEPMAETKMQPPAPEHATPAKGQAPAKGSGRPAGPKPAPAAPPAAAGND